MNFKFFLFPNKAKFYGVGLMLIAIGFAYWYFWGGKPDFFIVKVFAIASVYMESRYFVLAQTNILDELAAVLFVTGITIFSFSKEKNEESYMNLLRIKALISALYLTLLIWILSFFLIYGLVIFLVSSFMLIIFLLIFNLIFRYSLYRQKRTVIKF